MPERPYAAHEALIAPVRAQSALWRLVLGMVVIAATTYGGMLVLSEVIWHLSPGILALEGLGRTPGQMYLLLGMFLFPTLGVVLALRLLSDRNLAQLLGTGTAFRSQARLVLRMALVLVAISGGIGLTAVEGSLSLNTPWGKWLLWLPLSLLAVLVQVSAEEILFRGYLQQQLAARFESRLIWMGAPTILFALGHYDQAGAGQNAWIIVIWAGFFGLCMADLTARAGTLAPAIILHFVNNVFAMLVISVEGDMSGLALFVLPFGLSEEALIRDLLWLDFMGILIAWLGTRLVLRR